MAQFYFERVPENPNVVDLVDAWWEVPPFQPPEDPFKDFHE